MHYNLLNECMNCQMSSTEPKVGMLATMFCGSDRYAMVVTEVINKKKIKVSKISDYELNNCIYTDNETNCDYLNNTELSKYAILNDNKTCWEGAGYIYTYRKNCRWMPFGADCYGTCSVHLGKAENYRDPSF